MSQISNIVLGKKLGWIIPSAIPNSLFKYIFVFEILFLYDFVTSNYINITHLYIPVDMHSDNRQSNRCKWLHVDIDQHSRWCFDRNSSPSNPPYTCNDNLQPDLYTRQRWCKDLKDTHRHLEIIQLVIRVDFQPVSWRNYGKALFNDSRSNEKYTPFVIQEEHRDRTIS